MINYKANASELEMEHSQDEPGYVNEGERMYNGYPETVFDGYQLDEIDAGERDGVDVSLYAKPENGVAIMHEIRAALKKGLDVERYLDRGFSSQKLGVITAAIEHGLTHEQIDQFADSRHNWAQMSEVAKGIKQGVDVSVYNRPEDMDANVMCSMRHGLLEGCDLRDCWKPGVSGIALEQVLMCYKEGLDANLVKNMIEQGRPTSIVIELTRGLYKLKQDDVNCKPFSGSQVVELAFGANDGIDYERYLDPMLDAEDMRKMRLALTFGVDQEVKDEFGNTIVDLSKDEPKSSVVVEASGEESRDGDDYTYANEEIPY